MGTDEQLRVDTAGEPGPVFNFVTLEQAAEDLGTSPQGVVLLLGQHGLTIRRLERAGRTLSGVSRGEVELLRSGLEVSAAESAPESLRERLLTAELALEEARTDQEVARQAFDQLARVTGEAEASQELIRELRERIVELEAECARGAPTIAERDRRIAALEGQREQDRSAAALALQQERRKTEAARAERRGVERRLADELGRVEALRGQLRAAGELEAANARFLDQVEEKLAAANHTISYLRRRSA